jgi:hypothetical protein
LIKLYYDNDLILKTDTGYITLLSPVPF